MYICTCVCIYVYVYMYTHKYVSMRLSHFVWMNIIMYVCMTGPNI